MHHETVDLGAVVIRFFRVSGACTFDASDFDDSAMPLAVLATAKAWGQTDDITVVTIRRLAQ